jgi:hypothetical protein
VDHISNLVKESLQESGMEAMTMKSVRGASPSKLVQIFPDMEPQVIALGGYTHLAVNLQLRIFITGKKY